MFKRSKETTYLSGGLSPGSRVRKWLVSKGLDLSNGRMVFLTSASVTLCMLVRDSSAFNTCRTCFFINKICITGENKKLTTYSEGLGSMKKTKVKPLTPVLVTSCLFLRQQDLYNRREQLITNSRELGSMKKLRVMPLTLVLVTTCLFLHQNNSCCFILFYSPVNW